MFILPAVVAIFLSGVPQVKTVVEGVVTRNNHRIPADTIQYNIRTKPGDVLDPSVIRADIRRLYSLGYFDNIAVYEEPGTTGPIVIFDVKEKPIVRTILYKGLKSYTQSEILNGFRERKVGLTEESPLDTIRITKAEAVIKELLGQKGHQDATVHVERREVPPGAIDLTFVIDEGPTIKIEKIGFQGNSVFSGREIRNVMKLEKQAGPISSLLGKDSYYKLKLVDDLGRIRTLYDDHGYVRVDIHDPEVVVKPKTVHRTFPFFTFRLPLGIPLPFWGRALDRYYITIKIDENDQYRIGSLTLAGARVLSEERIRTTLAIHEGDVFDGTAIRKGFDDLKKVYGGYGYINYAPIPTQDFDEPNKRINLSVNIEEGHQYLVHRINFLGNTTTHDKVIRREIKIDEGSVFNSQLWDLSILRLNQLGYFESLKPEDTEIKPAADPDAVDINLRVKEKDRSTISFTGGISGVGGSFLGMNYETNNFLGMGETFQVSLQGGTRASNYAIGFTEPYFKDRPLTLGGQIFLSKLEYEQIVPVTVVNTSQLPAGLGLTNTLNFTEQRAGFSTSASYPIRMWTRGGLNFTWENSRTDAVNPATQDYFSTVVLQQQSGFISNSGGFNTLHGHKLIPTYLWNTTDSPVAPHKGQSLTATLDYTGRFLGGNVEFTRPTLDYRYFHPVNRGLNTLAFRFLGSYIRPKSGTAIPFYDRFFLGGDFDIRGFDFRAVSPIVSIIRQLPVTDAATGVTTTQTVDDIVYVGGDTQGVFNFEYRIPLAGPVTLAPYLDIGGTWATQLSQLVRNVTDAEGVMQQVRPRFLAGTNSGLRSSTGLEFQVQVPIINAPFRLIFDYNPLRIDRQYFGIANGLPFQIKDPATNVKFTVGRTF